MGEMPSAWEVNQSDRNRNAKRTAGGKNHRGTEMGEMPSAWEVNQSDRNGNAHCRKKEPQGLSDTEVGKAFGMGG
jgi:hypothetical protein